MGWDVDAIYDDDRKGYVDTKNDATAASAFQAAFDRAVSEAGSADGFLSSGGLDVSACVQLLADLAGEKSKCAIWDSSMVKQHWNAIVWPDVEGLSENESWYIVSAREFLRVCAENGYGIQFDR